jgi:hypothetical protein
MWFWNTPDNDDIITYKTILFVAVCAGLVWATARLVTSVGDTTEKIDDAISSDDDSDHD